MWQDVLYTVFFCVVAIFLFKLFIVSFSPIERFMEVEVVLGGIDNAAGNI